MDSSGLRFYYTDKTRKYDAATIFVGGSATTTQLIPPGQKNFIQESFCSGELTQVRKGFHLNADHQVSLDLYLMYTF